MKTLISGGSNYQLTECDLEWLDRTRQDFGEVVTGGCTRFEAAIELWALDRKLPLRVFKPNPQHAGNLSTRVRDIRMIEYVDAFVPFPDASATLIALANESGLRFIHPNA